MKVCIIEYWPDDEDDGECETLQTNLQTGSASSSNVVQIKLSGLLSAKLAYNYTAMASNGTHTVKIEGSFNTGKINLIVIKIIIPSLIVISLGGDLILIVIFSRVENLILR